MRKLDNKVFEFTLNYNQFKKGVFNYCLRMLENRMAAEDITQTVFLKYFENFEKINNKNSTRVWLFTIAKNEIYAYYRSKKTHIDKFNTKDSSELEIHSGIDIEEKIEQEEIRGIIIKELNLMPIEQKEIYLLKEFAGLNYMEISKTCKISLDLVKSRLYNARQKLINKVKSELEYNN